MSTIALSTIAFGWDCTARRAVQFALDHEIFGVEFGSPTFWPDNMPEDEKRFVRESAASHEIDLSIHHIHRGVAPASHDSERRARHLTELEATLNLAYQIGARPIVLHPGPVDAPGIDNDNPPENVRLEALENLTNFVADAEKIARETGTVICLENLFHTPGNVVLSYQELVGIVESVNSPAVRITLDTGHAYLSDGVSEAFEAFGSHIRHIHMHDSDGKVDHFEVGEGVINLEIIQHQLAEFPFTLALETQRTDDGEAGTLRSRDRLKALLGDSTR
ncbi:MAG: sugar phosphate isomerase/epimerase [Chloroflexi bacterium]|nr:sugar phosphate isomerase/epimerase [Chloroflexota bacterium]